MPATYDLVFSKIHGRIISGHYRIRAVRRLRWKQVLCRVISCDQRLAAIYYCTSNLLTRGLSAMEEAYLISRLVAEEKFTLTEIRVMWGRSKSWVSRRLKLLSHLNPKLKKELGMGYLSPRLAQEPDSLSLSGVTYLPPAPRKLNCQRTKCLYHTNKWYNSFETIY
ncbi:MAG: ParB/RepB/Spo0J family partition protein [Bacillota bacterium]